MDDVGRLCQRFLLGRADFTDLIAINNAINTWVKLRQNCQDEKRLESEEQRHLSYAGDWDVVEALFQRTKNLTALSDKISQAIIVNSDDPGEQPLEVDVIPTTELSEETDTETLNAEKPENSWSINPRSLSMLSRSVVHSQQIAASLRYCQKCMPFCKTWSNRRKKWKKTCKGNMVCCIAYNAYYPEAVGIRCSVINSPVNIPIGHVHPSGSCKTR